MEFIPIKTRILHPPKDNLIEVFDESLTEVHDDDIIIVTSKVVAIHQGRCVPMAGTDKEALIAQEADRLYIREGRTRPLTITQNALISASGIDESNGEGYYILLPKDVFVFARTIREHLQKRHCVKNIGVVITDSHSLPFRYGALSIAIGCWGFVPIENHVGRTDIFGRELQYSKTNIPDAIAAAATLISGECDEVTPIQIARGIPNIVFSDDDPRPSFFVPYEDDLFKDLYRDFK